MSFDFELNGGDLVITSAGAIKPISNTPKLRQDILKMIITALGANKFHPWYGCTVSNVGVGKNYSDALLAMDIQTSIRQSLDRLKTMQDNQAAYQNVSLSELILSIESVYAERSRIDPRQVTVQVKVITKQLSVIEEVFSVSI